MKTKIIIYILIFMLMFPTVLGIISSSNSEIKKPLTEGNKFSESVRKGDEKKNIETETIDTRIYRLAEVKDRKIKKVEYILKHELTF